MREPILRLACAVLYAGSAFGASLYLCSRHDHSTAWSVSPTSLLWATVWTLSVMQPLVEFLRRPEPEGVPKWPRGQLRRCNLFHVVLVLLGLGYEAGMLTNSLLFAAVVFVIHPVFLVCFISAFLYGIVKRTERPVEMVVAANAIAVHCVLVFREYFMGRSMWI